MMLILKLRQVGWVLHSVAARTFTHHQLPQIEDLLQGRFRLEQSFCATAKKLGELQLDHSATRKDIESALRRLYKGAHPDKIEGSEGRSEEFIRPGPFAAAVQSQPHDTGCVKRDSEFA